MTPPQSRLVYIDDVPTPYRLDVFRIFASRWSGAFRILFCASGERGRTWNLDFAGLDATVLPGRALRAPGMSPSFSVKWNPGVLAQVRRFRPTVAVCSGYMHPSVHLAAAHLRRRRVPYGIACESSFLQQEPGGMRWRMKRALLAPLVGGMSFGLPCGTLARDYLAELAGRPKPMFFLPNAPDAGAIAERVRSVASASGRRACLRRHGVDPASRLFLFVGRLEGAKRPDDALRAFAALPAELVRSAALLFVGDGRLRGQLEAARDELQLSDRVAFAGWLPPDAVFPLMGAADMMLLPSSSEAWGAVVNESLAAGTPVLASDQVASAHDLIEDGRTGWIVPVGDVPAMTERLARLLRGDVDREAMRTACSATGHRFDAHFAADNLMSAIGEVCP